MFLSVASSSAPMSASASSAGRPAPTAAVLAFASLYDLSASSALLRRASIASCCSAFSLSSSAICALASSRL